MYSQQKRKNTPADLKKIIMAILLLAVKDLQANKHVKLTATCSKEMLRTAWLLIFEPKYNIIWGEITLSLEDILYIVSNREDVNIAKTFRTSMKKILTCQ